MHSLIFIYMENYIYLYYGLKWALSSSLNIKLLLITIIIMGKEYVLT
jgi:hypothetical protein